MPQQTPAIAEIVALLGKKWMMRIIWELRGEPLSFRQLQAACGQLSPSVVNQRLKQLQQSALVIKADRGGYALSPMGQDLLALYQPLKHWAVAWQRQMATEWPEST